MELAKFECVHVEQSYLAFPLRLAVRAYVALSCSRVLSLIIAYFGGAVLLVETSRTDRQRYRYCTKAYGSSTDRRRLDLVPTCNEMDPILVTRLP